MSDLIKPSKLGSLLFEAGMLLADSADDPEVCDVLERIDETRSHLARLDDNDVRVSFRKASAPDARACDLSTCHDFGFWETDDGRRWCANHIATGLSAARGQKGESE